MGVESSDLSRLTLRDALDLACFLGREEAARYRALAVVLEQEQAHDVNAASAASAASAARRSCSHGARAGDGARFFAHLADGEDARCGALLRRRVALFGDAPTTARPARFFAAEPSEADDPARGPSAANPVAGVRSSRREAAQAVVQCEERAWDFLTRALPRARDPAVRDLLQELLGQELEHQQLVKAELSRLL